MQKYKLETDEDKEELVVEEVELQDELQIHRSQQ
jgi:hypothetical protein